MGDGVTRDGLVDRARRGFRAAFGRDPGVLALAPGRVNLIGEHTDYNDGLVMPMAIDAWCACAATVAQDAGVSGAGTAVVALDAGERRSLRAAWPRCPSEADADGVPVRPGDWMSYVGGVLHALAHGRGDLPPLRLALSTTLPIGGGLSSSAALEVSVALAALEAWGLPGLAALELARACQRAEHDFAGVPCGLMDQCASILGREGHALLLDCRMLTHTHVPIAPEVSVVVVDTGVRHALAGGEYAARRRECRRACEVLGVESLRDATPAMLEARRAVLVAGQAAGGPPEDVRALRRARHVVEENARVARFADALNARDWTQAGRLMLASHASLRDDYQVSCPELDRAVQGLSAMPGVFGTRMTGGGFGGCAIALVQTHAADQVAQAARATGLGVSSRVVQAAGGAARAS